MLPVYNELNEAHQTKLENEFLSTDKFAKKYRRKGVEGKRYATIALNILLIGSILMALQSFALEKLFGGVVYNQKYLDISEYFLYPLVFIWILSIVMCLYSLFSFRKRRNKQLYAKKFQKWLKSEKSIIFKPNFISELDRIMFEEIDIETKRS